MTAKVSKNQLRLKYTGCPARPAFSLAELVVSVGILLLMLALVGQVYSLTVRSTGQATALSEVNQQLRVFEQRLREDLANVRPDRSIMVIQGNSVNAYWTSDQKEADDGVPTNGYPHSADPIREDDGGNLVPPRADLLMFFTEHQGRSYTDPRVTSNIQQVVYGHAELGDYVPNEGSTQACDRYEFQPGPTAFPQDSQAYPSPTRISPIPAQQWHLARRAVLMLPGSPPPRACNIIVNYLDDDPLLQGATDFIGAAPPLGSDFSLPDCGYETFELSVLSPVSRATNCPAVAPWYLPPIFGDQTKNYDEWRKPYARSQIDPTPPPLFADRLSAYGLPNCASFKVEWTLDPKGSFVAGRLAGVREVLWFDPGRSTDPNAKDASVDPLASLASAVEAAVSAKERATEIQLASLLGGPDYESANSHNDGSFYSLSGRFHTGAMKTFTHPNNIGATWPMLAPDDRANLVAFGGLRPRCVPDSAGGGDNTCPRLVYLDGRNIPQARDFSELVSDDLFPSALRITLDVYDKQNRLERPIRHVMVIPVGK